MTEHSGRRNGGYPPPAHEGEDDPAQSVDYDGGLRSGAEGGRVAVFRGTGRGPAAELPSGQTRGAPPADVDSPFLGLFHEPPPAPPAQPPQPPQPPHRR